MIGLAIAIIAMGMSSCKDKDHKLPPPPAVPTATAKVTAPTPTPAPQMGKGADKTIDPLSPKEILDGAEAILTQCRGAAKAARLDADAAARSAKEANDGGKLTPEEAFAGTEALLAKCREEAKSAAADALGAANSAQGVETDRRAAYDFASQANAAAREAIHRIQPEPERSRFEFNGFTWFWLVTLAIVLAVSFEGILWAAWWAKDRMSGESPSLINDRFCAAENELAVLRAAVRGLHSDFKSFADPAPPKATDPS